MHRETLRKTGNLLVRGEIGYCEILARAEQARLLQLTRPDHSEASAESIRSIHPLLVSIGRRWRQLGQRWQRYQEAEQPTQSEQRAPAH